MKLFVCYGLFPSPRPGGHPCRNAALALREAGHDPEIVKTYGLGLFGFLNRLSPGRREVRRLTGQDWVPVLVTDDGRPIHESEAIIAWAKANPAGSAG